MTEEILNRIVALLEDTSKHRYCEDGFYACPKNPSYFGSEEDKPINERVCYCNGDEAEELLKEIRNDNAR